ncbi:DUF2339 domain-containing protein [Dongia sp. agr-C8]
MVALLVIAGLFFLVIVPILAISASMRAGALRGDVTRLQSVINSLQRRLGELEQGRTPVAAAPTIAAPPPEPVAAAEPAPATVAVADAQPEPAAPPEPAIIPEPAKAASRSFEQRLGGSIFVWIGAVMLALAGAFLVKYSIDVGLLSPAVRVFLGLLMGAALLGAGQWMRKRSANIAQALAAAAIADWFASLFAATSLYHLIDPLTGFIALGLVTAIGIALSLREGMLVGLVGIAGGLITPAIVHTDTPQPAALFVYLYLIQLGALVLQHKRGWWQLAALGIGGGLFWALVLAFYPSTAQGARLAALWLPLFLLATDLTQLWSLYGKGGVAISREMTITARAASIACCLLMAFWLTTGSYRLDDWGFLVALVLLHLVAARKFTREEIPALVGAAIAVAAFAGWSPFGYDWSAHAAIDRSSDVILIGLVLGAIFGAGGFWFELGSQKPVRWAGLSTLGTAFLFGGAYLNLKEAELLLPWTIQAVILAGLHMGAAERLNRLRHVDARYTGALGLHCLAVSGFLALAVPMQLEQEWIAVSWAIELPIMAWVALKLDLPWLKRGIWAGGALVVAAVLLSGFPAGEWILFNRLLYGIGIPCIGLIATAQILKRTEADKETRLLVTVLELAGAGLLALLIALEIDHAVGRVVFDSGANFLRVGLAISVWAALALALHHLYRRQNDPALLYAAHGFTVLACLGLVLGGIIAVNPLFEHVHVGETWVFNRLMVVYAIPAVLLLLLADQLRRPVLPTKAGEAPARIVGLLALVTGFIWVTLTIRQIAQGPFLDAGLITDAEQYGYSAAWTLYGLMLLGLGTWKRSQILRYASAVVILITVSKVFLIDASDLTGLYRVASFLGLGLSLIGIGYLYQRLLFRRAE